MFSWLAANGRGSTSPYESYSLKPNNTQYCRLHCALVDGIHLMFARMRGLRSPDLLNIQTRYQRSDRDRNVTLVVHLHERECDKLMCKLFMIMKMDKEVYRFPGNQPCGLQRGGRRTTPEVHAGSLRWCVSLGPTKIRIFWRRFDTVGQRLVIFCVNYRPFPTTREPLNPHTSAPP